MSECMSDLPRYLHRSAPCAYSKYAVFVYSRAETTGLPAGGLWITTNCHSYRQAYWYAQEYGCKHVFYQTMIMTCSTHAMIVRYELVPIFYLCTAARSRPNFDDVIRAGLPRHVTKFTYYGARQSRISSLSFSRFRALNLEHFGSDLLPISRFSSEF